VATGTALLPTSPGSSVWAVEGVAALALACGVVIGFLPWGRWRSSATLWLMPVSLACVALFNIATDADGFRYGLFYMVVFIWLGLGHRQGMSLRFAPLLIVSYLIPLAVVGESSHGYASTAYAVPTTLIMGETVSWVATRARRSEQRLRASEGRFRSLVSNAADVITVVDVDGIILYESPPITSVLGYEPDERVGTRAADRVHPDDRRALAEAMADLRATPDSDVRVEVRVQHADGTWRWCSTAVRNLLHDPSIGGFVCNSHDVTEERKAAAALVDSEASFRMMFTANPRPMWVWDRETMLFLEVNDAAIEHYGFTREEFLAKRVTDIRPSEDMDAFLNTVSNLNSFSKAGVWRHQRKDGSIIDVDITSHRLTFAGRDAVLVDVHDVTERHALEQQLRHQAFHDSLTGLANRPLFVDRVEHALAVRRRDDRGIAVLLLDLDRFKTVNDSLGHNSGDEALAAAADRVSGCLRSGDTAARLGGDEFVVLLEDVESLDEVTAVATRINDALRVPFALRGREVSLAASIGIVLHRGAWPVTADELIRNADAAMYAAKANGTGSWQVFEAAMHEAAVERLELEAQLRGVVERDELVLHYQPIVSLTEDEVLGYEALVRWRHPTRGLVPPFDFIPAAEETGLIVPIGAWVIDTACHAAAGWAPTSAGRPLGLSVNLSARQLFDPSLVDTVAESLRRSGIEPARLTLEITESVLVADTNRAVAQLDALKALGVRIAIDDFGTGYSSLSYLRSFPVDILKVDKAFTDTVAVDVEGACFVQAILHLAQVLRVTTVAEGVEVREQADRLRELGCDQAQGYFFGRPAAEVTPVRFLPSRSFAGAPMSEVG
jgi:diguanylate cyclase (GGDEF)-like protein/PAS domain S-box-containing protein